MAATDSKEGYDEIYGDLYGSDTEESKTAEAPAASASTPNDVTPAAATTTAPIATATSSTPQPSTAGMPAAPMTGVNQTSAPILPMNPNFQQNQFNPNPAGGPKAPDQLDEGKMFIGGLNWDTTDDALKAYFEQFGTITHCTIMRDLESGRSRGFAFLSYEDPASVNTVLSRDHYLDGKTIDPKRAVPRSEASKSDKLFVRQLPLSCTPDSFRSFWRQYGIVTDATLMMDKETGRHRGFGFVNFESGETTQKVLDMQPIFMDSQALEIKRAQAKGEPRRPDYGVPLNKFNQNQQSNSNQNMMGGNMNTGFNPGMAQPNPAANFDPQAMSRIFQQMGWGAWNPMMMNGMGSMPGMTAGMPGMNPMAGMGMPGMPGMNFPGFDASMAGMNQFGGAQGSLSPMGNLGGVTDSSTAGTAGSQSSFTGPMRGGMRGGMQSAGRGGRGGHSAAPTGPAAMRQAGGGSTPDAAGGAGPQRTGAGRGAATGGAGYHPYSR